MGSSWLAYLFWGESMPELGFQYYDHRASSNVLISTGLLPQVRVGKTVIALPLACGLLSGEEQCRQ